jgi:formate hydrogenlyase subunit 3/multisubunit Na+/H+ antiporter MnhD subunit
MVFGISTIFFLEFLARYTWLQEVVNIGMILRIIGVLMVASAGIWVFFQRNLGRILGYAMVIEVGYSLLSISLSNAQLHYAMLAPRMLAISLWGLALSMIRKRFPDLRFSTVKGVAQQFPVVGMSILISQFSIAGLPLLAGFPNLLELWQSLSQDSVSFALWALLGSSGLAFNGMRSFAVFVMDQDQVIEDRRISILSQAFLIVGILGLVLMGIFPQWVYPFFSGLSGTVGFSIP